MPTLSGSLLLLVAFTIATRIGTVAAGGVLLPFGATAIFVYGGASVGVSDLYYAVIFPMYLIFFFRGIAYKATVIPVIIGFYGCFAALVFPVMFENSMSVFSLDLEGGSVYSLLFSSTMHPLGPSFGNLTQSIYLILGMASCIFFYWAGRRNIVDIHNMLIAAAYANIFIVGVTAIFGTGAAAFFRTADYADLIDATFYGASRLVGGFSEASRFSDFSAIISSYFWVYYIRTGRLLHLAVVNSIVCLLALSSTGVVALFATFCYIVISMASLRLMPVRFFLIMCLSIVMAFVALLFFSQDIELMLQHLIFNKGRSTSGLERGAWSYEAWRVFINTYGLGAGTGSVRANGLIFVLLSNIGIIGVLLFSYLIFKALGGKNSNHIFSALNCALFTAIVARLASIDVINQGVLFYALIGARLSSAYYERSGSNAVSLR